MSDVQEPDHTVLHQDAHEALIESEVEAGVGFDNAAITNASVAHALNASFSDTEVEAALNALGTKINSILAALRTNGIILT